MDMLGRFKDAHKTGEKKMENEGRFQEKKNQERITEKDLNGIRCTQAGKWK